jgi:hypothetical protein
LVENMPFVNEGKHMKEDISLQNKSVKLQLMT